MNGEFPYCETDPFMDELKQAAFDTIYKYGSEECDEWIKDLIACYPGCVCRIGGDVGDDRL